MYIIDPSSWDYEESERGGNPFGYQQALTQTGPHHLTRLKVKMIATRHLPLHLTVTIIPAACY